MKYLLIVLAILMLGCGTDTAVVEEPPPVAEDTDTKVFVVHEIGPTPEGARDDLDPPRIIKSNVYPNDERDAYNPDQLNKDGIFFDFNEDLHRFVIDLSLDGESLGWIINAIRPGNDIGFSITLNPPANGPFLERAKEYLINLNVGDTRGGALEIEIPLRTIH